MTCANAHIVCAVQAKYEQMNSHKDSIVPPIVSIVGKSGAGKTTVLEKLVRELKKRGYRIGTVKHDVHDFDIRPQRRDQIRQIP